MFISGLIGKLSPTDYVGFIFCRLYGYDAASAFFSFIPSQFDKKWRTSVLVSGLITFYCRSTLFLHERLGFIGESQHSFVDFNSAIVCLEFYLIKLLERNNHYYGK
jgi:hypothetical protein